MQIHIAKFSIISIEKKRFHYLRNAIFIILDTMHSISHKRALA